MRVSRPRRLQAAWRRPRPCSTGSVSGLRTPAGARARRGGRPLSRLSTALSLHQLLPLPGHPEASETVAVPHGVVLHLVPAADHLPHQRRVHRRPRSNHKKACARAVLVQQVQHPWRHVRIRPVIERQGDDARRRARQVGDIGAEHLVAWPQGGEGEQRMAASHRRESLRPVRRCQQEPWRHGCMERQCGRAERRRTPTIQRRRRTPAVQGRLVLAACTASCDRLSFGIMRQRVSAAAVLTSRAGVKFCRRALTLRPCVTQR